MTSTFNIFSVTRLLMTSVASQLQVSSFVSQMVKSEFFIFNDSSEGGTLSISNEFHLGEGLSGLPLVLGLLGDWVIFDLCFSIQILHGLVILLQLKIKQ